MERALENAPALLERLTDSALHAIASGGTAPARVLRLLLRGYAATGREALGDALGVALAASLVEPPADDVIERALLFVEAAGVSDDERMSAAAVQAIEHLRRLWTSNAGIAPVMRSIDVAIQSIERRQQGAAAGDLLPSAIDHLEHVLGQVYRPGAGVVRRDAGGPERARLADQIAAALALTTAYRMTARLPYAMLAEELLQFARRTWWNAERSLFDAGESDSFVANCDAVRLLLTLGDLHGDEEYRRAAIFAADANYLADARQLLAALERVMSASPASPASHVSTVSRDEQAAYGIALHDWLIRAAR